mgnify:CR=1 FL=1
MSRGSGRQPPQELKMNAQTFDRMNQTASGIVGVVETLRNKLAVLDSEIKADEDGKAEYEKQIARLQIRRDEIKKRLDANSAWAETSDREIGPFQSTRAAGAALTGSGPRTR